MFSRVVCRYAIKDEAVLFVFDANDLHAATKSEILEKKGLHCE